MRQVYRLSLSLILFGAVFAAILVTSTAAAVAAESPPEALIEGNTAFALKLYGELGSAEGNLFFSPYSISSALGMTYAGARRNTATEMKEALHFQLDQTLLHFSFKRLSHELAANARKADQKLNIANGLCLTGGDVSNDARQTGWPNWRSG